MSEKPSERKPASQEPVAAASGAAGRPVRTTYANDLASRTIYAEGIQGLSLRGGVARVDFYQVVLPGTDKEPEQRVVSQRLVLTLAALDEFAVMLGSIRQALQQAKKKQDEAAKSAK